MCTWMYACVCKVGQVQKDGLASPQPLAGKGLEVQKLQVLKYQGSSEDKGPLRLESLGSLSLHHHRFSHPHAVGPGRHT